jgi:aspartyl-tRNA(Asn)/glutamyl-tRNA(Gln) amidotransferase subunit B
MRKKEDSHDYRYFPEPDLPTIMVNQEHIDEIKKRMPVLPAERIMKYCQQWGLSDYDANVLVSVREIADFFDQVMDDHSRKLNAKLVANWIIGQLLSLVNKHQILFANSPIGVKDFADLMRAMDSNEISQSAGKLVLEQLWEKVGNVPEIIKQNNLAQVSDETALREMIQAVIDDHPTQLEEYRSGKDKLFGFFVGKAMAASKGKANPSILNEILKSMLSGN